MMEKMPTSPTPEELKKSLLQAEQDRAMMGGEMARAQELEQQIQAQLATEGETELGAADLQEVKDDSMLRPEDVQELNDEAPVMELTEEDLDKAA